MITNEEFECAICKEITKFPAFPVFYNGKIVGGCSDCYYNEEK